MLFNSIKEIIKFSQEWIRALANAFAILKPILAIFRSIYLFFEDIATYFSGGESYFGDFIEGMATAADKFKDSFTIQPPEWAQKIIDWWNGRNSIKPNANGEYMSYPGDKPSYMSPINTNRLSNNTSNINTNNQFTINSNQPVQTIATNLINTFTPTQVQFSTLAV